MQVTTVNQQTATRSANMEPLKTLGDMGRKGSKLGWDADRTWKSLVFFGEALPCGSDTTIKGTMPGSVALHAEDA